jgi:hypothetical protein
MRDVVVQLLAAAATSWSSRPRVAAETSGHTATGQTIWNAERANAANRGDLASA